MPAPSDLRGVRFGNLVVLGEAPRTDARCRSWHCRCDCGARLVVLQRRLTTKSRGHQLHACEDCRARRCEICDAPIPRSSSAKACSEECRRERKRRYQLEHYYLRRRDDPAVKAARSARARRDWEALSPEERLQAGRKRRAREIEMHGVAEMRARGRAGHARRMENPDYAERRQKQMAVWAANNPEKVKRYHREAARRKRTAKLARDVGEDATRMMEAAARIDATDDHADGGGRENDN